LKFLAAGGIAAVGSMAGLGTIMPAANRGKSQAAAQSSGSWSAGPTTLSHPVHVALLYTGKVLYVAGSGYHTPSANGPFKAGIWDPVTNEQTEETIPEDLFCCGHTVLPNGNILLAGGTLKYKFQSANSRWWGQNVSYEFDVQSESFLGRPSMAHGRWYPTLVLLPDGRVQVVDGFDEFGYHNLLNEIYNPATQTWSMSFDPNASRTYCVGCDASGCANVPGAGSPCYGGANRGVNPGTGLYPRMHLMPSGLVAAVGQNAARRIWNPETGRWHGAGNGTQRSYGTSVLLPLQNTTSETGRILVCGGAPQTSFPAIAANTAEILEPSGFALNSRSVQSMTYPRRYCNPVILPTGKVIIFGGTRENNDKSLAVYNPEMFDPLTETWTVLSAHAIPRIYHSGAILLQDGRVWTVGSSYSGTSFELRTEIFSPLYVSEARPSISGTPTGGEYGGTISVPTPNASGITSVSLLRISSTTHHYNTDQRLVWLQILSKGSGTVTASAPINSKIAPPGYYMVHLLNSSGVPSVGAVVRIGSQAQQPVFYDVPSPGDGYVILKSGGDIRAGEEARSGSLLVGKSLKRWKVYLRKRFAPSGSITAVVRRKSDDSVVATFSETINASSLPTNFAPFEFTLPAPRIIQTNDRILVQYDGPSRVDVEGWNSDKFDGSATRRVKYNSSNGYSGSAQDARDTAGTLSSE
ncbi:MAG TPA: galactose oxidase-like domain-containing protein, partial [Nitrososphaera sp.]|nr:galactose oxidase-like domain-containing protein [Nitrososphaera sp.]